MFVRQIYQKKGKRKGILISVFSDLFQSKLKFDVDRNYLSFTKSHKFQT